MHRLILTTMLMSATALYASPKVSPKLSKADAEKIALAKEAGTVKSAELETEHSRQIYSFDIQTASSVHEVNVDANTGAVVEDSVETPADEAREKQEDAKKATHK